MTAINAQQTTPTGVQQAAAEDITWPIDMTNLLTGAETVTEYSTTLTKNGGGEVTLEDEPTLTGNMVLQRIQADVLVPRSNYTLTVYFTPSGTTNIFATTTTINCPF